MITVSTCMTRIASLMKQKTLNLSVKAPDTLAVTMARRDG